MSESFPLPTKPEGVIRGTAAGRFYDFPRSPVQPPVAINGNTPT
jgi:hypothetical protein